MKRVSVIAMLLLAAPAPASAQRLRIAIHPLTAPSVDDAALVKELDAETRDILVGTGRITPVNADDVAAQLAGDGGKCSPPADRRLKCLERLALTTRAEYALAVELKKFGKSWELSAVLLARNGNHVTQPEAVGIIPPNDVKPAAVFKVELRKLLLDRMKLATIPPVPAQEVQNSNPVRPDVPPPMIPALTEPEMSRLRKAGFMTGGLAVVLAAVAGGAALSANAEVAAIVGAARARGETSAPYSITSAELDQARSLRSKHSTAQTLGTIAGVAAATGVLLFFLGSPDEPAAPVLSAAPTTGGAVLSLSGSF